MVLKSPEKATCPSGNLCNRIVKSTKKAETKENGHAAQRGSSNPQNSIRFITEKMIYNRFSSFSCSLAAKFIEFSSS
jgi:hypothetical protein